MSQLILVRHAQASFFGGHYDQLSDRGRRQAAALGRRWARSQLFADSVFVGPARRHQQTEALLASELRGHGGNWPEPVSLAELAEHQSTTAMEILRPSSTGSGDGGVKEAPSTDPSKRSQVTRHYFEQWIAFTRRWLTGELAAPGVEDWRAARQRARQALETMTAAPERGQTVVAFSSGGLIAMILGEVLGLSDDTVFDLSLVLGNSAYCEVRYSGRRRSLVTFNATPHLSDEDMKTII